MIASRAEILIYLGKAASITDADSALLDMLHPLAESALLNWIQNDLGYAQHVEFLPIGGTPGSYDPDTLVDAHRSGGVNGAPGGRFVISGGTDGRSTLQLKHTPVIATAIEVREDLSAYAGQSSDPWNSDTILTQGTDYWLDLDEPAMSRTGLLHRVGSWPNEPRSVKVTYYGGYAASQLNGAAAGAIKLAAILTVVKAFKETKVNQSITTVGSVVSETIGKYSVSYGGGVSAALTGMMIDIPTEAKDLLQPFRNYGRLFA